MEDKEIINYLEHYKIITTDGNKPVSLDIIFSTLKKFFNDDGNNTLYRIVNRIAYTASTIISDPFEYNRLKKLFYLDPEHTEISYAYKQIKDIFNREPQTNDDQTIIQYLKQAIKQMALDYYDNFNLEGSDDKYVFVLKPIATKKRKPIGIILLIVFIITAIIIIIILVFTLNPKILTFNI